MAITWARAPWLAATAYRVGQRVINGNIVFRCTAGGTSADSGGPSGTSLSIADGGVTWEYLGEHTGAVVDLAPELDGLGDDVASTALDAALRQLDGAAWGDLFDDAQRTLAAHLGTLAKMRGRGPILQEALGQASRTYASLLTSSPLMGTTIYGVELRRLARLTPWALGAVT